MCILQILKGFTFEANKKGNGKTVLILEGPIRLPHLFYLRLPGTVFIPQSNMTVAGPKKKDFERKRHSK